MNEDHVLLEYIWLDGYSTPNLRSKIKVVKNWNGACPNWNFDGSSTQQAPGEDSECILIPARNYKWNYNHYLVLCEVYNVDGSLHDTNSRAALREIHENTLKDEFWFGFEQEYFITKDNRPLGFPAQGYPEPQGLYYCGVGGNQVQGRQLVEKHLNRCLDMGIYLTGVNAEVAVGQWEYQCFSDDALKAADDLWISRYVLYRLAEEEGVDIDLHPKPITGDWNGSGCHANFSNKRMRNVGGEEYFSKIFAQFDKTHQNHIVNYGENNHHRLTGEHETQHINTFSWGVADRGASLRVPNTTYENDWKGYIEDRRPAANCDPYVVARLIVESVEHDSQMN